MNLAPYQIRYDDNEAWLENTKTGAQFLRSYKTGVWMTTLKTERNRLNSDYALDALGV